MAVLESHCAKRESIGKNIMRACYSHVTGPLSFLNMSQTCHERLSKGKEAEIKGGKRNLRRHWEQNTTKCEFPHVKRHSRSTSIFLNKRRGDKTPWWVNRRTLFSKGILTSRRGKSFLNDSNYEELILKRCKLQKWNKNIPLCEQCAPILQLQLNKGPKTVTMGVIFLVKQDNWFKWCKFVRPFVSY